MKRDMDIIRRIMLAAREAEGTIKGVEGISQLQFAFHVQLLEEAELLEAIIHIRSVNSIADFAMVNRLTGPGHDLADSMVDDAIWNKVKKHILKDAASWTFGILRECLKIELRKHIPGLDQTP